MHEPCSASQCRTSPSPYPTVLYSISPRVHYSTVQYFTVLCSVLQYLAGPYSTLQYLTHSALSCPTFVYTTLPYLTLVPLTSLSLILLHFNLTLPYLTLPHLAYLTLPHLTLPYLTLPYLTLSLLLVNIHPCPPPQNRRETDQSMDVLLKEAWFYVAKPSLFEQNTYFRGSGSLRFTMLRCRFVFAGAVFRARWLPNSSNHHFPSIGSCNLESLMTFEVNHSLYPHTTPWHCGLYLTVLADPYFSDA